MAISYKTQWQEATKETETLRAKVEEQRRQINKLAAALTSLRKSGTDTRQIVDLAGIARHMRVERFTPQQWKQRNHLPPVDFPEISEPLWYVSTLMDKFVIPTGRIWYDHPGEALPDAQDTSLYPAA